MQVNNQSSITYKGFPRCINNVNPIYRYSRKAINKMAEATRQRVLPISPDLEGKVKYVQLNEASAWDINPNHSSKYVLFLHGMAQNVSSYQRLYEAILQKGLGVFAVEYRGHGTNKQAEITEDKLRSDVKKAYKYLTKKEEIQPENITVVGHSMGTSLATNLVSKNKDISSLILISPIASIAMVSQKFMLNKELGLGIPPKVKQFTDKIKPLKWLYEMCFNTINKMKDVKSPTYIIQSQNDSVTKIGGSRRLAKVAKRKGVLKEFVFFPKGGHNIDKNKLEAVSYILEKSNSQVLKTHH